MTPLPIDPLLPLLVEHLRAADRVVLRAPPGAGKTTRVPATLLDAGLAGDKQVVVLEPRRIAASAAAAFVAAERRGRVGAEVGYRVRFAQAGGPGTRLWFLTEGVLGRQLVRDPFLEAVGVVVLDEFHERHLQGDVALAVIRELQDTVRPDLKLVVMSATLETERLAAYLGDCPVLTSEGRAHPVAVEYAPMPDARGLVERVVAAVRRLLDDPAHTGDVLVFLPGAAEIRRTATALEPLATSHRLAVTPLHGDLPLEAQQQALRRGPQRKIVLATNVAETALTIEGVTAVVDSGLARVSRFDAKHGINALRVTPISRAAAEQRAGRAGRTAPGRCVRLWSAAEDAHRLEREVPEILRLDLSATLLELRAWGLRDVAGVRWLNAPSDASVQRAERLLRDLGAVGADGGLTPVGRRMLELSVPPRLARMLVEAERRGCAADGAVLAALAAERDICVEARAFGGSSGVGLRADAGPSDLLHRAELFDEAARAGFDASVCRRLGLDPRSVRAVDRARRQLLRTVGRRSGEAAHAASTDAVLRCVLAGFPDRVVRRRAPGSLRGVMVGGTGVTVVESSVVREAEYFVAVEVDAGPQREFAEACVRIARAVEPAWLDEMIPGAVQRDAEVWFDPERERVVARRRTRFHDLVLQERIDPDVDPAAAGAVLADVARANPERVGEIGAGADSLLQRLRFLRRAMPERDLPDADTLLAETVARLCAGCRSFGEVRRRDVLSALRQGLPGLVRQTLEREAPATYRLPSGREVAVGYETDRPPIVRARIQELFGLMATPRLAGGRVPLVIELLAPNQRPVQITDDLANFWRSTYAEVRKQLRGRYPKHAWPDDPLRAPPTSRVRRS